MRKGALCACVLWFLSWAEGRDRVYYLTAEEVEWDFAPTGRNLVDSRQSDAAVFLEGGDERIGRTYRKCIYKRYTDATYRREIVKPGWMGIMGPTLSGEVGDRMLIYFLNKCSRAYTVHPHGVMYDKDHEGALYLDGTSGADKQDDMVPPGGNHTYIWKIPKNFGPTVTDPTCVSWVYHSHIDAARDPNSGLIGLLLTCKQGTLNSYNTRKDGQKDYSLLFKIFDENLSWYIDENLKKCGNVDACETLAADEDEDFAESNLMHSINGFMYGNAPPFEICEHEKVTWHLVGMGTEVDLHTTLFHGQTLLYNRHRTASLGLFPAEFKTAQMIPQGVGRWLINCQVNDHYTAGMQVFMDVKSCANWAHGVRRTPVRIYYIAAEETMWNYAPSGEDKFLGGNLTDSEKDSSEYYTQGPHRIGGIYKKALFYEYTDGSFTMKKGRSDKEKHLGFLGPVIKAEAGETVIVVFKNLASRTYSMQSQGVQVDKGNEGSNYNDSEASTIRDGAVAPGDVFVYSWFIPHQVAPSVLDPDCITYFYQSGVDPVRDTSSGLVGPLLVCKPGSLSLAGKQKSVEREFALLFTITDENLSWYIEENIKSQTGSPSTLDRNDEFEESNRMRNINGRGYGNLDGLMMQTNSRVSWHLIGLGTESDLHAVYFHGNTLTRDKSRMDTVAVFPGTTSTVIMKTVNAGIWGIVSRTNVNYVGGMTALYMVYSAGNNIPNNPVFSGKTRVYYIGVVETEWDYAPQKSDIITGDSLFNEDADSYIFVRNDTGFIGTKYTKALFKEFTDSTFTTEFTRDSAGGQVGFMGPFIRAEVGDIIQVHFKNMASRPYSLHPHGLIKSKGNEGAQYLDKNSQKEDDAVGSGESFTYVWHVSEHAGPAKGDPNCISWPYYSSVEPVRDSNSGLIGPLLICRAGTLDSAGRRRDAIDREIVLLFTVTDENKSWYIDTNINKYAPTRSDKSDPDFEESNLMHGINGRIYGSENSIVLMFGETVAWYVIGMGSDIDIHTIHFHGQTLVHKQEIANRVDVIEVFPGTTETLEMRADNPGTWFLHCHVVDHFRAGMEMLFTILEPLGTTTSLPNVINPYPPWKCLNEGLWRYLRHWFAKRSWAWNVVCRGKLAPRAPSKVIAIPGK